MKNLDIPAAIAKAARGEVSFALEDVQAPTLLFTGPRRQSLAGGRSGHADATHANVDARVLLNCGH